MREKIKKKTKNNLTLIKNRMVKLIKVRLEKAKVATTKMASKYFHQLKLKDKKKETTNNRVLIK